MMIDEHPLEVWYRYAAGTDGFIGAALRAQRGKAFLLQEQQRALLGIQGEQHDQIWLHLQAMHLPRGDQFMRDLERIVAKVESKAGKESSIKRDQLGNFIREGLA